MNGVDIAVLLIVILLVLLVIFFRFIFPKILNRNLKKKGKEVNNDCVNCKRH